MDILITNNKNIFSKNKLVIFNNDIKQTKIQLDYLNKNFKINKIFCVIDNFLKLNDKKIYEKLNYNIEFINEYHECIIKKNKFFKNFDTFIIVLLLFLFLSLNNFYQKFLTIIIILFISFKIIIKKLLYFYQNNKIIKIVY